MSASRRFAAVVVLLATALGAACSSVPPAPAHDCLAYWGADADALIPLLQSKALQHGPRWAVKLRDQATFDSLTQLKAAVEEAVLSAGPTPSPAKDVPGTIPPEGSVDPELDMIRDLAHRVRAGSPPGTGGLEADRASGCHPGSSGAGWLGVISSVEGNPIPNSPVVLEKAHQLLTALKEALDM